MKNLHCVFILLSMLFSVIFACKQKPEETGKDVEKKELEFSVEGVKFVMKTIPATSETTLGDESIDDNKPYKVSLDSFMIGETEVTQELWNAVMGKNPSKFNDLPNKEEIQEKRPVESVSWYECILFCNELTKKLNDGKETECVYYSDEKCTVLYTKPDVDALNDPYQNLNKKGFRLPTEAEWGWAAMGGENKKFAGTEDKSLLSEYAWFSNDDGGDADGKTHEVKKKKANGYSLYDMCGNIREWCWNRYTNTPQAGANPTGEENGGLRISQGGSYFFNSDYCAIIYRGAFDPAEPSDIDGLRLVCRP